MKPALYAALAATTALLGACSTYPADPMVAAAPGYATDAAATAPSCFRTTDIGNHTVGDARTLYLKVGLNDIYRVETAGNCATKSDAYNALVIKTVASSTLVCRPLDLDIAINRSGFVSPCIVSGLTQLTPAEIAALPAKLRP